MLSQHNVKCLLLGKDLTPKTTGTVNEYTDLTDGQAAVVGVGGACYANAGGQSSSTKIRVVVRNGTKLIYSPFIYGRDVVAAAKKVYSAPAEQVSYIGYNGSGNAITVTSDNEYRASIELIELDNTGKDMRNFIRSDYDSDASATALEITEAMITAFIANRDTYAVKPVSIGRVCNTAVASGYSFDNGDATVVQYNRYITIGTNCNYNTGTALAVGDYIRIGTVGGATALTSHVYKVVELTSATVLKLDQAVEEASGTYARASHDIRVIPAATVAVADFGFKITGLPKNWSVGLSTYSKNRFKINLVNFGSTVVTYTTGATEGSGYYQAVADIEWFAQQNEGAYYRAYDYESNLRYEINSAVGYNLLGITCYDKTVVDSVAGVSNSPQEIFIAAPTAGNDQVNALQAVLDDCFTIATL